MRPVVDPDSPGGNQKNPGEAAGSWRLTTSVEPWIRVFAGTYVLATLAALVLLFSSSRPRD